MKKKIIIWVNRLFKKEKISLDVRAQYLFKSFDRITEDCSPIAKAKVFNLFKDNLQSYFIHQDQVFTGMSVENIKKAKQNEDAFKNLK